MRIVVTGASGNVGTALLAALDPVHDITGVARRFPDLTAEPYRRASWHRIDIGESGAGRDLTEVFAGADAVVHLAWAISPTWGDPPMWRTNDHGTRHVLSAVAAAGVPHLVCASSVAAYAPGPRSERVTEQWPHTGIPASAYSRGKAGLEALLDFFAEAHPEVGLSRVRPCAVLQRRAAGEFARWVLGPMIPPGVVGGTLLPVPLWADLRAQAVHTADVAEALRLILESGATGPFNLAAPGILDATALARVLGGRRVPVAKSVVAVLARTAWLAGLQPLHPGWLELADQAALVDTRRAETVLGWQPRFSSAEAVRDLVAGLRERDSGRSLPLSSPRSGLRRRLRSLTRGRPIRQSQA